MQNFPKKKNWIPRNIFPYNLFFAKNFLFNDFFSLQRILCLMIIIIYIIGNMGGNDNHRWPTCITTFFSFEEQLSLNHVDPLVLGARIGERTKCSNFAVICFHASTKQKKTYNVSFLISKIWQSNSVCLLHIQHYSKLRKNVRVTQSQNVPLSCLSLPLADWLAEAAYRDILGLSYARAFSA